MLRLIINADDFGLNQRCTDAICEAFEKGLITDTTLLANGEAFDHAADKIKSEQLGNRTGIHFNITEGRPLTEDIKKYPAFTDNGCFHGKINRLKPLSKGEKRAVYEEFTAQAQRIEDRGIHISHADSHHHIHTAVFIAPIVVKVCREHGLNKIRIHRNIGSVSAFKAFVKARYNKWLSTCGFVTTDFFGSMEDVQNAGPKDRLEIMVHPDYDRNGVLIDRTDEADGLAIGEELAPPCPADEITLISYEDL